MFIIVVIKLIAPRIELKPDTYWDGRFGFFIFNLPKAPPQIPACKSPCTGLFGINEIIVSGHPLC